MKIETIQIEAGETPMGTLTMATNRPRRKVRARVLRESTWRRIRAVLNIADRESWVPNGPNTGTFKAIEKLKNHLDE